MKRKLLLAFLIALMMMSTLPAMAASYRFCTVSTSGSVNVRASASTNADRVTTYRHGTWLRILSQSGNWYRISGPDGVTGWVRSDLVYLTAAAKGTIGIVDNANGLPLRKSASDSARSLGTYPKGTPCILLSESNGWYHVTVDGKAGYFKASQVDREYMTYASELATVDCDSTVKLREGPGTGYSSIKNVKNGAIVMVLQEGDGWHKVSVAGTVGFIDADFLRDGVKTLSGGAGSDDDDDSSSYTGVATVKVGSKLHLRAAASSNSASLGLYRSGTVVRVLSKDKYWCHVRVDGITGYMYTAYLRFGASTSGGGNTEDGDIVSYNGTATVKLSGSAKLHLRESASSSSDSLGMYRNGTVVTVLGKGSAWCRVKVDGVTGYMATRYLRFGSGSSSGGNTEDGDIAPYNGTATVKLSGSSKLHLRESATTSSDSLGSYRNGTVVTVLGKGSAWCCVQVDGKMGYMATRYLRFGSGSSSSSGSSDEKPVTGTVYALVKLTGSSARLNLRESASEDSAVLGKYPRNTMVQVLTMGSQWCKVKIGSDIGYMATRYLDFTTLAAYTD